MYASDAPMCPSGQRRQPKFDHFQSLLSLIRDVAAVLMNSASALNTGELLDVLASDGHWTLGDEQRMFAYRSSDEHEVVFVENASNLSHTVRVPIRTNGEHIVLDMQAYSAVVFVDGANVFDSSFVKAQAKAFKREVKYNPAELVDWNFWIEPAGAPQGGPSVWEGPAPIEQTWLNVKSNVLSDYAWYETHLEFTDDINSSSLVVDTQSANAIVVYIDGAYVGAADTHNHVEGNVSLRLIVGDLHRGNHSLSILSESLGYSNLIGRWGASTKAKRKGISGEVVLTAPGGNSSLTDGRAWRSFAGLHGERSSGGRSILRADLNRNLPRLPRGSLGTEGVWASARFRIPLYDPKAKALFVDITRGRGHLWLNGIDLGRYWNITRGATTEYSQRYYFLPFDFLFSGGQWNELVMFDAFGSSHVDARLLLSWVEPSDTDTFEDDVDFPFACI